MHRKLPFDAELEDLQSAAQASLLRSARNYDPSRQVPFEKYAAMHMRWDILAAARAESGVPAKKQKETFVLRSALAAGGLSQAAVDIAALRGNVLSPAEAEGALDDLLSSYATAAALRLINRRQVHEFDETTAAAQQTAEDPETLAQKKQGQSLLEESMAGLDEREKFVIHAIFFEDRSLSDVAEELGCDRSWVCRVQHKAISKLKGVLIRSGVRELPIE